MLPMCARNSALSITPPTHRQVPPARRARLAPYESAREGCGGPPVGSLRSHRYHPLAARAVQPAAARQACPACAYRAHSWSAAAQAHLCNEGATERHDAVGVWHALAPSGRCPAPIPTWDWQLLLAAARAERSHERYEAMERLRASSSLAYGELVQLVHSYRAKLRDPEFAHILDPSHARCGGRCSSMVRVPPQHLCPGLLGLAPRGPGCAMHSGRAAEPLRA